MIGIDSIGRKGGTSATANKKAETIEAIIDGVTFSKRVFHGQRVLLVYFKADRDPLVTVWHDEATALENANGCEKDGYRAVIVQGVVKEPDITENTDVQVSTGPRK